MNRSIVRLFGVIVVLFALLVVWTSRWTVFDATALQTNPRNKLGFLESLRIKRGRILADDGTVLAASVRAPGGVWSRRYPDGSLFAQPIGYFIADAQREAGLEAYRSTALQGGVQTTLSSVFGRFTGNPNIGYDVETTLDPAAQTLARTLLAGRTGSVVALDPQTGAVKVMYSNPTYDDNDPSAPCSVPACQYNLATEAEFPPGSTFKIVTTTAALDSGKYTPTSIIDGKSPIIDSGFPLQNDNGDSYGPVTLTMGLTDSINTVYAQVGQGVGLPTMAMYMKRFGFYSTPPLDYPKTEMIASGERKNGNSLYSPTSGDIDLGRMSIGQDKLAVTPLQMAMVASAVADGGTLMKPRMTTRVVNADGQTVQSFPPTVYHHVMKRSTAQELTKMMTDVVEEGTGQAANLGSLKGEVAGKTGTAQLGNGDIDYPWFIGFAPVSDPTIAVAVVLNPIPNGYGGVYAAPIAAQIMQKLLAEGQ